MPNCRTNIIGIKIVYCVPGESNPQEFWVNLNRVHALAWCDDTVGERPKPQGPVPNNRIPRDPNGPGDCPTAMAERAVPVCWWNGTQWVCGEE